MNRAHGSSLGVLEVARTWVPRGVALAAFCLYAVVAPPGFYWLDSAELSAAAFALGSPHPTGFPLYCVLAKAATLVPIGELAFRINLLSACCAALAVLWTTRLVIESCRDDLPALVGAAGAGMVLALSLPFLRQATVAEVYAPTAALLAGTLVLVDRVARGAPRGTNARWGLALALVAGLGAGLHVTYGLVALPILALLALRLRQGARWPLMAPLLALFVAGALITYLPVRSAAEGTAAVDWGHPDRLDTLVDHLSAQRIRTAYADEMGGSARLGHHAAVFAGDMSDGVGPFTLLAALFGLGWLARQRRSRWLAATAAAIALGDIVYSLWINPMGLRDLQNGLPLTLVACLCAGAGVAWLARYLGLAGVFVGAVASLLLVIPVGLVSLPAVWPASAPGDSVEVPRAWSEAALAQTPIRGVALVQNDSTAAGLMFLSVSEDARPDVAALVRQHLVDMERTRAVLARSGSDAAAVDRIDAANPLASILGIDGGGREAGGREAGGLGRPVSWEIGLEGLPPVPELVIGSPLVRLVPAGAGAPRARVQADDRRDLTAAAASVTSLFAGAGGRDRNARSTHAQALTSLGRVAHAYGDAGMADLLYEWALAAHPGHVAALVNRGVMAAGRGDWPAAIDWTERALRIDPTRAAARINAVRFHIQANRDEDARAHLAEALRLAPRHAGAWALAAVLDLRAGHPARAREHLRRARELDPTDPDVVHLVEQLNRQRDR